MIMSVCTKRHKTFVTTRPRLQQSVTMKRMGTWKTDWTFSGSSSLKKSVPNPSGSTSSAASVRPRADTPQVSMCKNLCLRKAEACSRMRGSASPSFTTTRIHADATTTPMLSGRKSEVRFACDDRMKRTISLPRASGSPNTIAITSQQQSTAAATTPSTLPLATQHHKPCDFASASPTVPSASGASGSSAGKFSPTKKCFKPRPRSAQRSPNEMSLVITGEVSKMRMH
mmetsp:Transcript_5547/g.13038  ORF Transcript_5547/g.13038 Transcript_5547/m.13038 type:complete len:228 (+) Transcript_5547:547-1230(+)